MMGPRQRLFWMLFVAILFAVFMLPIMLIDDYLRARVKKQIKKDYAEIKGRI